MGPPQNTSTPPVEEEKHRRIAKRYSPYLANYYERIRSRRGTGRAIIALARKFLGIIYRTLKHNWVFEDFPNFALKQAEV